MTRLLVPVLTFTAAPALAHQGTHLHPHDSTSLLALLPAVMLILVAALIARGRT